jgi:hypothetical protein
LHGYPLSARQTIHSGQALELVLPEALEQVAMGLLVVEDVLRLGLTSIVLAPRSIAGVLSVPLAGGAQSQLT